MRYLTKFTKEENIKFISHLDVLKTIQKNIRRAELPIEYSQGFNPHMNTSIAQPLSVGVYSSGEYMDMVLTTEMDEKEIVDKLNKTAPSGIKYISALAIPYTIGEKKVPQAMALIDAARYTIKIKYSDASNLEEEVNKLLEISEWKTIKKSKKGEREINIRPLVKEFSFWIKDEFLILNVVISTGSREHLSADLLVSYIQEKTSNALLDSFVNIKREEMYFYKNNKLVPLYKCI
ncbi:MULTISPECIES: TIGR03936 family radical SAM-associated protein [unclassified Clostridium]|uniref:TIGR03936 family radical SAM-associated protein n=1 Tax=unclassified Clostridium TaxID=2614128 RepID=UPI000297D79F|nr:MULTISPECIES: TIGR03936 family radical SAM-associated protein [unclassified Clostridium]EKQ55110.1 MAG: radical SAM-linked protein [Clostridium sp. Maddingley MBC34-26]